MRRVFSIMLVGAVFLAFGFGAFLMLHKDGERHGGCIAGMVGVVRCENAMTGAAAAILHLSALTYPILPPALMALVLFLALGSLSAHAPPRAVFTRTRSAAVFRDREDASVLHKLRAWLSIHEKRDPSFLEAVSV